MTTKENLLKMELHEIIELKYIRILRVIGGWIYYESNRESAFGVFVPEPNNNTQVLQPTKTPVLDSGNIKVLNKEDFGYQKFEPNPLSPLKYMVDLAYMNGNRASKVMEFNDEKHRDNWENSMMKKYGTKVIGYTKLEDAIEPNPKYNPDTL